MALVSSINLAFLEILNFAQNSDNFSAFLVGW
jgi:hypothetical protein